MKDLKGKVAFITGGAAGIGYALAEAFGKAGMKIMIAGINKQHLDSALANLRASKIQAERVQCDVSNRADVEAAARATLDAFGKVHVVCNNAGVGVGGMIGQLTENDWDWIIDVNLKGVVHGTEVFAPLIERHGEGGHIVNTSSIAGMLVMPGGEPYSATKYAVVAMTEGWRMQLAPKGIGVSVLCPGFVRTHITDSQRNRPARYGDKMNSSLETPEFKAMVENGMEPAVVADRVIEAIKDNELYIFTHLELRQVVEDRFKAISAAMDKAASSPALKSQKRQNIGALGLAPGKH
jgi:NAD(P)-dependent dehydrogenase (short-subunit alcohol dehydrogenase family)